MGANAEQKSNDNTVYDIVVSYDTLVLRDNHSHET